VGKGEEDQKQVCTTEKYRSDELDNSATCRNGSEVYETIIHVLCSFNDGRQTTMLEDSCNEVWGVATSRKESL